MSAIERAIERVEKLIADSQREQLVIIAAARLGWEDAYALTAEELQAFTEDERYDEAWDFATWEHHEAYDQETGSQASLNAVLAILREEADRA